MAKGNKIIDALPKDLKGELLAKPQLGELTFEDLETLNSQVRRLHLRDPQVYRQECETPPGMPQVSNTGSGLVPTPGQPPFAMPYAWGSCSFTWPTWP